MSRLAKRTSCPVCDRDITLTKDGRMRPHKAVGDWCFGADWVPAKRPSICPDEDDEDFDTVWQVETPPMWSCYRAWDEWWRDDLGRLVRVVTAVDVLHTLEG